MNSNKFKSSEIFLARSPGAELDRNKFRRAPRQQALTATLHIVDCAGASVTQNKFRRTQNPDNAILIDSTGVLLEANNVKKAGAFGIHLLQGGNTLRSNIVKKSGELDLFDEAPGQSEVQDNTFGTTNL